MKRIALCASPTALKEWADRHGIKCELARDSLLSEYMQLLKRKTSGGPCGVFIFENEDDAVLAMLKFT